MYILKRDIVALFLSYALLRLTVLDESEHFDSRVRVSIDLSFYAGYTALPPCPPPNTGKPNCRKQLTAKPALDLAHNLLIVPLSNTISAQTTASTPESDDVESRNGVHLRAYDVSPWRYMTHTDALPFHPLDIGIISYHNESTKIDGDGSSIVPLKIVPCPRHQSADVTKSIDVLSVWSDGTIMMHQVPVGVRSKPTNHNGSGDVHMKWDDKDSIRRTLPNSPAIYFHINLVDAVPVEAATNSSKKINGQNVPERDMVYLHVQVETRTKSSPHHSHDEFEVVLALSADSGEVVWSNKHQNHYSEITTPDCFLHFRSSMMDTANRIFPHAFWGGGHEESKIQLARFNRKHRHRSVSSPVLVTHTDHGLRVYAARNGQPVCHLTLLEEGHAYADVNGDGVLDQIHVPANEHTHVGNDGDVNDNDDGEEKEDPFAALMKRAGVHHQHQQHDHKCLIASYSGIPARELLFHFPTLCEKTKRKDRDSFFAPDSFSSAPPMFLPADDNDRDVDGTTSTSGGGQPYRATDVFVALHTGVVLRLETPTTETRDYASPLRWQSNGDKVPKWNPNESGQATASLRPLPSSSGKVFLVSGESSMAVLSRVSGQTYVHTDFLENAVHRPILIHGGEDDSGSNGGKSKKMSYKNKDIVLIPTMDGVWGYTVTVEKAVDVWTFVVPPFLLGLFTFIAWKVYNKEPNTLTDVRSMDWG